MRTTIDLGEDIFYAAKAYAKSHKQTMGEVVTAWAREKFASIPSNDMPQPKSAGSKSANAFEALGFRTLPKALGAPALTVPISNEQINQMREQEGI
jgi:hypothetical protein